MKRLLVTAFVVAAIAGAAAPASALCVKEPRHGHYLFCLT